MNHRLGNGQALVEFALVLPLLVLLIFGLFDLGWSIYANNTIADAARQGSRTGIILSKTDSQIKDRVIDAAPALGITYSQITITPSGSRANYFNTPITVTVVYTYVPMTPVIGKIVTGSGLKLSATSSMIIEGVQ
jgi:Flp pilus assembly protein TadG